MKIIKQGKPPEEKGTEITCPNCNSELEYSPNDIFSMNVGMENMYGINTGKYISCPVCANKIKVT